MWSVRPNAERDEIALFDSMAAELYVAVISDVLDSLGFRDQVMRAGIHSVWLPMRGRWWDGRRPCKWRRFTR